MIKSWQERLLGLSRDWSESGAVCKDDFKVAVKSGNGIAMYQHEKCATEIKQAKLRFYDVVKRRIEDFHV